MSYYPTERRGGCMESISRCCRQAYVYPLDTRKLLYIGGGVVGVILVAVVWTGLSSSSSGGESSGSTTLAQNPFVVGSNFFLSNLRDLEHNQVSKVNFEYLKNDTVFGNTTCSSCQTDLQRLQSGSVSSQLWSINVPCSAQYKDAVSLTLEQVDAYRRLIDKYPKYLSSVTSAQDILDSFANSRKLISSVLAVNSGHSIDGRLAVLRVFKTLGVRVMGLTSNCSSDWATSYTNTSDTGLSAFGLEVVKEMNRLGVAIDLSETSHQTQLDVLSKSSAPVIFTHTASYTLCNNIRNIKDDVLDMLKSNATGIVMVTFAEQYLNTNTSNVTMSTVVDHLNYFKSKIGIEKVGIGAEFDAYNEMYPAELSDVSTFPALFDRLKTSGWSSDDLIKLAGGNFISVLRQIQEYAENHASETADEAYVLKSNVGCYSDFDLRNGTASSTSTSATTPTTATTQTTATAPTTSTTAPTTTATVPTTTATVPTTTATVPTTTATTAPTTTATTATAAPTTATTTKPSS